MEILVYGTLNSISLALIALGFTFVYSISRLPNFAHGALYIMTGYAVWMLLNRAGLPYPAAVVLGVLLTGAVGALMYRFLLVRIRGMEMSEIIATYAIGLAIIEGVRWGGLRGATFTLPSFVSGSVSILGVALDYQRIVIMGTGAAVFVLLYLFTHHTKTGLALRGMAQDERAAMMLGIDSDRMATVAFAIGSGLAGFSAVFLLPLGNIAVESGYQVLVFSIAIAIIGGLGSWAGAIIASFIIGFAQVLTEVFISAHYQMVVALLAIILTLLIKPSGLLGKQKELEERV
jgi:branched-chain amino acid transport system permease protein